MDKQHPPIIFPCVYICCIVIYLSASVCLGQFHIWHFMMEDAINIGVQMPTEFQFSLDCFFCVHSLIFWRNFHTASIMFIWTAFLPAECFPIFYVLKNNSIFCEFPRYSNWVKMTHGCGFGKHFPADWLHLFIIYCESLADHLLKKINSCLNIRMAFTSLLGCLIGATLLCLSEYLSIANNSSGKLFFWCWDFCLA